MKITGTILGLWLACSLFAVVLSAGVNRECPITDSPETVCIPLPQCPSLFQLYNQPKPLSAQTVELLRNSRCGSQNRIALVCCDSSELSVTTDQTEFTQEEGVEDSECQITDSLRGVCVSISQCPRLYELYSAPRPLPIATTNLIQGLQCGTKNGEPRVCCSRVKLN